MLFELRYPRRSCRLLESVVQAAPGPGVHLQQALQPVSLGLELQRLLGERVAEALALRPTDVDVDRATLRVLHGKGDKARTVPLVPGACAAVQMWLARQTELRISRRAPLFCTLDGRKSLYPQQVRTTVQHLADRAGLEKRVHPHALRRAFAVHLDRQGVPVTTIQYVLGHASLSITTRYLAGLGQEEHLKRVRRVPW